MNGWLKFLLSLVLATVFSWPLAGAFAAAVVFGSAFYALLAAMLEQRLRTFSDRRFPGPFIDALLITFGLAIIVLSLPDAYQAARQQAGLGLSGRPLESMVFPASLLFSLGLAALSLVFLLFAWKGLGRACANGQIRQDHYRATLVIAIFFFLGGLVEFAASLSDRINWTPIAALAAFYGLVLPYFLKNRLTAKSRGAIWLVAPFDASDFKPLNRIVRRFGRKLSTTHPVNLVTLPQSASMFGGEHLDLGFRLGKVESLFPRLRVQLRDWLTTVPPVENAMCLPRRELYPGADIFQHAISDLVDPQDVVVVLSQASDAVDDAITRQALSVMPVHNSLHIKVDDTAETASAQHVRGYLEFTVTREKLSQASPRDLLKRHLPSMAREGVWARAMSAMATGLQGVRLSTQKAARTSLAFLQALFRPFGKSAGRSATQIVWPLALLLVFSVLVGLDAHAELAPDSWVAEWPLSVRALNLVAGSMLIFAVLIGWLRSTLPGRRTWVQGRVGFPAFSWPTYGFALAVASIWMVYPFVIEAISMALPDAPPVSDAANEVVDGIEEIVVVAVHRQDYSMARHVGVVVSLLLMWIYLPFRGASEYRIGEKRISALVLLSELAAPRVGWWRVLLYSACGAGIAQIVIGLIIEPGFSLLDSGSLDFIRWGLSGWSGSALTLFLVTWFTLLATRSRWAPYAPDMTRFVLACLLGALIAAPVGELLQFGLASMISDEVGVFGEFSPFNPRIYGWLIIIGAVTGGILFLQKRGLADLRDLRSIMWPVIGFVFVEGFLTSELAEELAYEFSDSDILVYSIYGWVDVVVAYLVFLFILPRLFLRPASAGSLPRVSSVRQRVGYRAFVILSLPVFFLLFASLSDNWGDGFWWVTETIVLAPARLLLVSVLCASLVVRLQRDLPRLPKPVKTKAPGVEEHVPKIFMSYRRDDTRFAVKAISEALRSQASVSVLRDIEMIGAGQDFQQKIYDVISGCDVMLVVIGDSWSQSGEAGSTPSGDPGDFVAMEVSIALKHELPIIPVLTGSASMSDLALDSGPLRALLGRQAFVFRQDEPFDKEIERLVSSIEEVIQPRRKFTTGNRKT